MTRNCWPLEAGGGDPRASSTAGPGVGAGDRSAWVEGRKQKFFAAWTMCGPRAVALGGRAVAPANYRKYLLKMAHSTGFEPVTSAFGAPSSGLTTGDPTVVRLGDESRAVFP